MDLSPLTTRRCYTNIGKWNWKGRPGSTTTTTRRRRTLACKNIARQPRRHSPVGAPQVISNELAPFLKEGWQSLGAWTSWNCTGQTAYRNLNRGNGHFRNSIDLILVPEEKKNTPVKMSNRFISIPRREIWRKKEKKTLDLRSFFDCVGFSIPS